MSYRLNSLCLIGIGLGAAGLVQSCNTDTARQDSPRASFQDDVTFMKDAHVDVVTLSSTDGSAKIAVCPGWQGRVMTSSATGADGNSLGWINRELIASGQLQPHINVYGGEDRFWLGPEGGQFGLFFPKGAPFDFAHWSTPAIMDTIPWKVSSSSSDAIAFHQTFQLTNYTGTVFDIVVDREIRLLQGDACWKLLGMNEPAGVKTVAYETDNHLTNAGQQPWTKDTGLLSIWVLGMYPPSPSTTIVVPIKNGPVDQLGSEVNDSYFGKISPDRLVIKDGAVFFKADGTSRGKIGVSPKRTIPQLGSYDSANHLLTIVQFTYDSADTEYVNSQWKIQDQPFGGDVANAYNDGPSSPGAKPLGPFYELESSSPAAALAPGKSMEHVHRTIHCTGDEASLNAIALKVFGVSLAQITGALP